jgi:hypothetical protein
VTRDKRPRGQEAKSAKTSGKRQVTRTGILPLAFTDLASWPLGLLALVIAALLLTPTPAQACAVCNDPTDKNRLAFLATTAVMTVLPLSLLGGLLAYLRRRARRENLDAGS